MDKGKGECKGKEGHTEGKEGRNFFGMIFCQATTHDDVQPIARTTAIVNTEKRRSGSVRGDGYSSKDLDFTMFKEAFIAKNNKIEELDKTLEDAQSQLKILSELVIAAEVKLEGLDLLQQFADRIQEELRVAKASRKSTASKLCQVEALNASLTTDVASLSWKLQEIQTAPVHTPQLSPRYVSDKGELAAVMSRYENASAHEMHLPLAETEPIWEDKGKTTTVSSFHLAAALNALQPAGHGVDFDSPLYSPRGK